MFFYSWSLPKEYRVITGRFIQATKSNVYLAFILKHNITESK